MILDTDVLSEMSSGDAPARVSEGMAKAAGPIYTTAINWAEVCYGIARSRAAERLREGYQEFVLPVVGILDFDQRSAEVYGELRADLERRGTPLDEADLMIAAIALRHDLALVSGNIRHFQRVPGLRAENWLT